MRIAIPFCDHLSAECFSSEPPTLRICRGPIFPSDCLRRYQSKASASTGGDQHPSYINDADFSHTVCRLPEPYADQNGFNFWVNQITGCGATRHASTAKGEFVWRVLPFIEFNQTGYFLPAPQGSLATSPLCPIYARHAPGTTAWWWAWRLAGQMTAKQTAFANAGSTAGFLSLYQLRLTRLSMLPTLLPAAGLTGPGPRHDCPQRARVIRRRGRAIGRAASSRVRHSNTRRKAAPLC